MPNVTPEMLAYSHIRYGLYFVSVAYELLANWILLETGAAAYFRTVAQRLTRVPSWQVVLVTVAITLSLLAITLPLDWFSGFWLEHHFHLSNEHFGGWLADLAKSVGVELVMSCFTFVIFFKLIRESPQFWPFVFAAINIPLIVLLVYIEPVVLEPIFNHFTPMPQTELRSQIQAMLHKVGVDNTAIFIADKSKQTTKLNAYVTGIGGTTRVVLWDNLIQRMPHKQILAVVGHELGHCQLHHIYIGLSLALGINFLTIPVNFFLARPVIARLPERWHLRGLSDPAIIPALGIIGVLGGFVSAPAVNAFSRQIEAQADQYALAIDGDRQSIADAFVTLSEQNLSDPSPPPLIEFWLFNHPSLEKRIDHALHAQVDTGILSREF